MSRTTWRVLRTELLRGTATVAAVVIAVAGVVLLFTDPYEWVGRWGGLAGFLRQLLIILLPLAVTAGAWQAGRERRRRTAELLGSTSYSRWQPVMLAWSAVTLGTLAGFLAVWLIGAVFVGRVAVYAGGDWPLRLAVAFVALTAGSAVGLALGQFVPSRAAAPVGGAATYLLIGIVDYGDGGLVWLSPTPKPTTLGLCRRSSTRNRHSGSARLQLRSWSWPQRDVRGWLWYRRLSPLPQPFRS